MRVTSKHGTMKLILMMMTLYLSSTLLHLHQNVRDSNCRAKALTKLVKLLNKSNNYYAISHGYTTLLISLEGIEH